MIWERAATFDRDLRRAIVTGLVVASLAGIWATIRWPLQRALASSSFGDHSRSYLVERTLREGEWIDFDSYSSANLWGQDGGSLYAVGENVESTGDSPGRQLKMVTHLFDERFRQRLSIQAEAQVYLHFIDPPRDRDGDGQTELLVRITRGDGNPRTHTAVLLRLHESSAEVAGWMRVTFPDPSKGNIWSLRWRKTAGNLCELQILAEKFQRRPDGTSKVVASEAVATFGWKKPGGNLRLQEISPLVNTANEGITDLFLADEPIALPDGANLLDFLNQTLMQKTPR